MSTNITVQLKVADLQSDHPAYQAAVEEFVFDARDAHDVHVAERDVSDPGGKGFLQELALVPSGPSAAWTVVQLVKLWLGRDRRRSIQITIKQPNNEAFVIEATGDSLSLQSFENAVQAAMGGKPD